MLKTVDMEVPLHCQQKAQDFFMPHQMGVACPSGSEKIIHGLLCCVFEHWFSKDFTVLKINLRNAFNPHSWF